MMKFSKYHKLMRVIIISLILLLSVYQINAQSMQDPNNAIELSDDFDQSQMRLTLYADNKDFCSYYVYISFHYSEGFTGVPPQGIYVTVERGKSQILSYKMREGANRYGYNYSYAMYRGNVNKLPNVDFTYRLPVSIEETVDVHTVENKFGYQLRFEMTTDTVYACRGGIVCDDELKDFTAKGHKTYHDNLKVSQITIYHADGSFGEYVFNGDLLVYPGKIVKMGAPIAIIKKKK